MFGKVKTWLGIEGVKIELIIPHKISGSAKELQGKVRLSSKNTQTVTAIEIKMIEKYTRGRKDEKLTDEYLMGTIKMEKDIIIPAEQAIEINFNIPFSQKKSEIDRLGDSNLVMGGISKALKWFEQVNSEFRLEASAKVTGVALDPFDKVLFLID